MRDRVDRLPVAMNIEADFTNITGLLQVGIEELAIERLRHFKRQYGPDELLSRCEGLVLTIDTISSGSLRRGNPLLLACYQGRVALVRELLAIGMALNARTISDDILADQMSPLMLATMRGRLDVVNLLLEVGDDLLYVSPHRVPVIMCASSYVMCDVIINEATKRNCLGTLLRQRCGEQNVDLWKAACLLGHAEALERLVQVPGLSLYTNIDALWELANSSPLNYPDQYRNFKAVAKLLYEWYQTCQPNNQRVVALDLMDGLEPECELPRYYHQLFGEVMTPSMPSTREHIIRKANASYLALLMSPHRCLPYLQHFNDEFERFCAVKFPGVGLPQVDESQFEFRAIGAAYYPIPKGDSAYAKHSHAAPYHKKHSALQQFLLLVLHQYGLGNRATKWVGFIPQHLANEQVANGDMFLEAKYNYTSLLHGSVSHMLQLIILIYAVDDGVIPCDYEEDGVRRQLSLLDLCRSQVDIPNLEGRNTTIFTHLRDMRYFNLVSFADPHRLFSVMMHDGKSLGLSCLANSLIDTFCKSIWKFFLLAKQSMKGLQDYEEFIEMLTGLPSELFANNLGFNAVAIAKYEANQKKYHVHRQVNHGFAFATADVKYRLNYHFEPRKYSEVIGGVESSASMCAIS